MIKEEQFDIYNADRERIGTASREEAHRQGLWHRTFQCWIWGMEAGKPVLLLQRRSMDKDTNPGKLDISCAGHLLAGESVADGIRELREELGVAVSFDTLVPCGIVQDEFVFAADWIDREISYIYLLRDERTLSEYRMQEEEVDALFRIPADALRSLTLGGGGEEAFVMEGLARGGQAVSRGTGRKDLVDHGERHFELLFARLDEQVRAC